MDTKSLELKVFMKSIDPEVFGAYFDNVGFTEARSSWFHMEPQFFLRWCEEPDNRERAKVYLEDLSRMQDVCRNGAGILIRACARFGLDLATKHRPSDLAVLLFVEAPHAFAFARSCYLLTGGASLNVYAFPERDPYTGPDELGALKAAIENWFKGQDKGPQCDLVHYREGDQLQFLIQRGTYLHTRAIWESGALAVDTARPAVEDILVFDTSSNELRVKTRAEKDREAYVRLFATHILHDPSVADAALNSRAYTLSPFREQKFSYRGHDAIRSVKLSELRMRLYGPGTTMLHLRSPDVESTLRFDLPGITHQSGDWDCVWLRFVIQMPGERSGTAVTVKIEPPSTSNLLEKKYAALIGDYLTKQGVKLR